MIISINNHKGGTGKTQASIHLAEALARKSTVSSVLVIDNDPQGDSSRKLLQADDRPEPGVFDIYESALEGFELEISSSELFHITKAYKNLYICPNFENTAGLEIPLVRRLEDEKCFCVLRDFLKNYRHKYDYILIDNTPSWSAFVYNSLGAADACIVPVLGASADSLNGIRRTFDMIRKIKSSINEDLRFLRVLVNNVDRRTILGRSFYENLIEGMGENKVFETVIPISANLQKSEIEKSTLFSLFPNSTVTKAYRALADEVENIRLKEFADKTHS